MLRSICCGSLGVISSFHALRGALVIVSPSSGPELDVFELAGSMFRALGSGKEQFPAKAAAVL